MVPPTTNEELLESLESDEKGEKGLFVALEVESTSRRGQEASRR